MQLNALFRLAFASASLLNNLTLLHTFARRTVLQKVPDHTHEVLSVLVGTGFQVLFHSPPGVLFTFPSQYYTLSVTGEYLGLEGGPPDFRPGFTCPAVLWILVARFVFRLHGSHILWRAFPHTSANSLGPKSSP